ncbi:MAG: redox-sensing transcriptional repressor Rex [Candidatus Hydrogenedentota bacterium]
MQKAGRPALNKVVLERLMHYYHFINSRGTQRPDGIISSAEIANHLDLDDTLVRKDLAAVGVRGRPRVGFDTATVQRTIREVLGFNESYSAIIVGAGRLGGALAAYQGFAKYGMRLVGLFDADESRVGSVQSGHTVLSITDLERVSRENDVHLAILTVPAEAAQPLAERIIAAGAKAIWNFAPVNLVVPENVTVRHEHISVGLAELAYHLKRRTDDRR